MTSNKTFLEWLISYNAHSRLPTAPVDPPPVVTPVPPPAPDTGQRLTALEADMRAVKAKLGL